MENPWVNIPNSAPYVLYQDLDVIQSINAKYTYTPRMIQTQLLPEPFIGNIDSPIILLTKNPGFDKANDPEWHADERFKELARANLFQEPSEYPFYFLNPTIKESPGAKWHLGKLRMLLEATSIIKVAQNICSIPSFPYHTEQFIGFPKNITEDILPSQRYTRSLVLKAIEREAIIILGSGKNEWNSLVPELTQYKKTFYLHSKQSLYISPKNLDKFGSLVRLLEEM